MLGCFHTEMEPLVTSESPAMTKPTGTRVSDVLSTLIRCKLDAGLLLTLYICTPNRGNAAAKTLLANELAARAEAAYSGYDSTRNVKIPANAVIILALILVFPQGYRR